MLAGLLVSKKVYSLMCVVAFVPVDIDTALMSLPRAKCVTVIRAWFSGRMRSKLGPGLSIDFSH